MAHTWRDKAENFHSLKVCVCFVTVKCGHRLRTVCFSAQQKLQTSAQLQYPANFLPTNQWTEGNDVPRTGVDTVAEDRTAAITTPSLVIVLVSYCYNFPLWFSQRSNINCNNH